MDFEKLKKAISIMELMGCEETKESISSDGEFSIVVLDRGWVYVGDLKKTGSDYVLSNAKNISNWGTEKGLGQLQLNGPTEKTKVYPCGEIFFAQKAMIFAMPTDKDLWKK